MPAAAQERAPRQVTVSGEATVTVPPDQAQVRFGISTTAATPQAARTTNAEASAQALNAVRALDIPEDQIQTTTLRLQPNRVYDEDTRTHKTKGFTAERYVTVTVRALDRLPTLLARVVDAGANRVEGITYEVQDRDAPRNEALQQAAAQARAKADLLARTLGAALGPVQQISEENLSFPQPRMAYDAALMKQTTASGGTPDAFAAGEIEVTARVQVAFALTDAP
ncbi:SIMPL domain-containing protein [Salisaeta longa]|uniref:SIMPL domain-containing protein n=1 Tax=Salisaeta longa TaxID=503170 RepID=UPI0003B4F8BB|nr:SIMPL domain-containing protein [Salisaeta longa]